MLSASSARERKGRTKRPTRRLRHRRRRIAPSTEFRPRARIEMIDGIDSGPVPLPLRPIAIRIARDAIAAFTSGRELSSAHAWRDRETDACRWRQRRGPRVKQRRQRRYVCLHVPTSPRPIRWATSSCGFDRALLLTFRLVLDLILGLIRNIKWRWSTALWEWVSE